MYNFIERVFSVKGSLTTSAFAREIGMQQKTVDLYLKGERKPSVEFIRSICSKFDVSADWLLGLPERGGSATVTAGDGVAVSLGSGSATASNCRDCPILLDFINRRSGGK